MKRTPFYKRSQFYNTLMFVGLGLMLLTWITVILECLYRGELTTLSVLMSVVSCTTFLVGETGYLFLP